MTRHFVALVVLGLALSGCPRSEPNDTTAGGPGGSAPVPNDLPALEVRDDTGELLLTWVDEQGDFHVVQKPSEVPEASREHVRVVATGREDGTGNLLYVADLRQKSPAGTYLVRTMTRAQWDEIGATRRKARIEALAPSAAPSAEAPQAVAQTGKVSAIIYGASWCKPCHQAQALLEKLGVAVTMKDIEKTPGAAREMRAKLARIGRGDGSIPVIDIAGQILIGFSAGALQAAVDAARTKIPTAPPKTDTL